MFKVMKMISCYIDSMFLRRKYLIHNGLFSLPIWNTIIRMWFIVFPKAWIRYRDCLIMSWSSLSVYFLVLFYCIWNIWGFDFNRSMSLNPHLAKAEYNTRTCAICLSYPHWKLSTQKSQWCIGEQQMENNVTACFCLSMV